MFKRDSQDSLYYESEKTGRIYFLYEGMTSSGFTSDMVFIYKEATLDEMDNDDYYGEVIAWVYGGFEELDFVEQKIKEYEESYNENQMV